MTVGDPERRYPRWLELWGVRPDEDPGKTEVAIGDVVEIADSPVRLPAHLVTRMYDAGEPGAGIDLQPHARSGEPTTGAAYAWCRYELPPVG